jgi:signal transduction histidine kinase
VDAGPTRPSRHLRGVSRTREGVEAHRDLEESPLPSPLEHAHNRPMSWARGTRWIATAIGTVYAAAAGLAVSLGVRNGNFEDIAEGLPLVLAFTSFAAVGALVVSRHPRHPVGWLFAGIGLVAGLGWAAQEYVHYALVTDPGSLPGTAWAGWIAGWWWYPMLFGVLVLTPLLFPTGRPASPRWRPVLWVSVAASATTVVLAMLNPTYEIQDARRIVVRTPIGVEGVGNVEETTLGGILFAFLGAMILVGVASTVVRYRRSRGEERQQLKWFAFAAALIVLVPFGDLLPSGLESLGNVAFGMIFAFLPVSAGIAILRYRLYAIDLVINRTLVYGVLAAFITAVYVGVVVGIGNAIGTRGEPNLGLQIGATALIAVAFQPVRARVQRLANRLVYGKRASPYESLAAVASQSAGTYATEDVLPRLARVVAEGTGARQARVWLRVGEELRPAAGFPLEDGHGAALPLRGDQVPNVPGATRTLPVTHRGDLLGALSVTKASGDAVRPEEGRLLEDLADQAGHVLRNVRLTEELRARLAEIEAQAGALRASRRRLVATQDAERRALERNIHDGAQQHLVALSVNLRLARTLTARDPEKARKHLAALREQTDKALETLRDLARGIYPPLLEAEGLAAALEAEAGHSPVPAEVLAGDLARFPPDVEAAAYFSVLEALQNAAKYAEASRVEVRLTDEGEVLVFSVADDGRGFDTATTATGSGLQNMADRLAAVGGTVDVDSAPGRGTTVTGRIPVREREPVA